EIDRLRGLGLHREAGRHRPATFADASLVVQAGALMPSVGASREPAGTSKHPPAHGDLEDIALSLLLEGVFRQYGFDFREYAPASLRRRVWRRVFAEGLQTISA